MGKQVAAGLKWGLSSVGRAPASQAGGREFESLSLHLQIIICNLQKSGNPIDDAQ